MSRHTCASANRLNYIDKHVRLCTDILVESYMSVKVSVLQKYMGQDAYKLGPSCFGPSFMWAELAWAELVKGRVVRNSFQDIRL